MRLLLAIALVAGCTMTPRERLIPLHYPMHPRVRSASGGPISIVGEVAHPGVIPYATGITFTCALRLAGGPTSLAQRALVRRGQETFGFPLDAIVDHEAPDPELAPGDVVTIQGLN